MKFLAFDAQGTDGTDINRFALVFQPDERTFRLNVSDFTTEQRQALQTAYEINDLAAIKALIISVLPEGEDLQALGTQAAGVLTQAQNRITQIAADRTALASAGTLAAIRPIVDRQLQAESVLIQNLVLLIRALRWMV